MASVPGKGARIAGQDYCAVEGDDRSDLDLGPGGLTVQSGAGKGETPEQTRK